MPFEVALLTRGVGYHSWSAVARGAVICGLQNIQIQSRQARRNYGIKITDTFDPKIHPIADKTWCHLTEQWETRNSVRWYVNKVFYSIVYLISGEKLIAVSRVMKSQRPRKSNSDSPVDLKQLVHRI